MTKTYTLTPSQTHTHIDTHTHSLSYALSLTHTQGHRFARQRVREFLDESRDVPL